MARVGRVLILLAIVAIGVILAGLLTVHTPWARSRALAWATGFVTRYHLELEAGSLGYNALTRRITLSDVRLAAEGHHDRPFLIASRIEVHLPWSVFRRRFAIDHLVIDGGIVDIIRDEHNVVNLPPGSNGPTPEQPRKLDVRSLTLNGLDVQYEDRARNWGIKVPRIESELLNTALGASGKFAVRGELAVHLRDRVMTMSPFETAMSFDGSNVKLDQATLSSTEIQAFLSGRINRVLDSPSLDLAIKGTVNLEQAIKWVPPPPVPISGTATLEGGIKGPASAFVVDLAVHSNTLAVGRERDLGLAGPLQVSFDAFTGHDLVITPQSGGSIRADFNVPWGGSAVSTAAAEWSGLDSQATFRLANVDPLMIAGAFEGHGTFEFSDPHRFSISNRSTGKAVKGLVPLTGTVVASIVGDDYKFEHKDSLPGVEVFGELSGRFNHTTAILTTMSGPVQGRVTDISQAAESAQTLGFPISDIMLRTHGALEEVLIALDGSFRDPKVEASISGEAVDIPLLGVAHVSAQAVATTEQATISALEVIQGRNIIGGDVKADITHRTWTGRLLMNASEPERLQTSVPENWRVLGHVSVESALGGTFDNPQLNATISGLDLMWADQPIDSVDAKAVIDTNAIDITSLELHQGAGFMDGRLRYAWDTGAYEAKLKGDRLSWQGSLLSPNDTQAIFALQFDGTGTVAEPKGRAQVDFVLSGGKAGALIGAGDLTADLLGAQAKVTTRLPSIGAVINADIATATPYDYRVNAQLDRFELQKLSPFLGAIETEILGFANGTITASGRFADDRDRVAFVNITELDAGIGGVPVTLNAPLNAELRGSDVSLKELFLRVGSGRLSASGQWNTRLDGTFRAQFAGNFQDAIRLGKAFGVPATLDGTGALTFDLRSNGSRLGTNGTLAVSGGTFTWGQGPAAVQDLTLNVALDGQQLTIERLTGNVATGGVVGSFSAKGAASIPEVSLAAIDGAIVLDSAKFTFSGIPVEQQRPSRLELAKGNVTVADASWLIAENPIVLGGSVGIAAEDPPLDLSVKGIVDLRVLSAFSTAAAFDGNANVDARIGGTRSDPQMTGGIKLDDVEVAIAEPRVVLSELSGEIALRGQVANFNGVRGLANGGALTLDGPIEFDAMALSGGALNIQAQGVALEIPAGLRSELDALVVFRPDPRNPTLTGDIRIVQSAYTETITIAALARQASASTVATAPVNRPYLERLQMDLSVTTTGDITVDNNYGRLAAEADVRVVGTAASPGMEGRITLREGGQIFLAGRTFRITRGDISFTDRRHIHPEFNIAAEANLGGGTGNVTMTLTGSLERPSVDLTSEEGSRTPGEIAAQIVGSTNADTALTLLSADLLGVTGRAIGLDAFRVERGEFYDSDFQDDPTLVGTSQTDPTTRLTIGKRLSDQVEFTVSQNLRENGKATFIVSYFPKPNVELRGISRDTGTLAVSARHQITFGGGVTKAPSERRVRPKISALTITGVDAATAAGTQSVIKLKVGDDFDFLNLQRDLDRIQENFHKLGRLEARTRTRRTDSEDATSVAIEFVVNPGPRTILEITGFTPPPAVVTELEEAWHKNAFDQFLIDDLTHRVRSHLVTSGDLGSVVVGLIDHPQPDTKRLRIEVTPGAPVTGREIRFTGNADLDATRLRTEILRAGIATEAWLDRSVVERTLTQVYNEEGFLKAKVVAQPLTIDDTTGVLPVEITEGPRAQITDVKWAGVGESRLAAIEKAVAIKTPTPLIAAGVNDARSKVEDYYRKEGFNGAEVEVQPAIADDDTVTLNFNVTEGTQQVLQSLELTGNEQTNGKVLRQALRFELGKPVDLDEWAKARKRLYDTNVFRLVDIQRVPAGEPVGNVQQVKAVVNVEEYPRWSFRYGVQLEGERQVAFDEFTSTRNLGVVAELRTPNLFGRALSSGLFGLYERDRHDATVYLATSRLFGWSARSTLYGFYTRDLLRDPDTRSLDFITDRQGISVDQRWRPKGFQIVYGYRFEHNRTYDPDPGNDPLPFDVIANLAKLSSAILFDHRDDPISPRKGFFSSVSFDNAAEFLGSDVQNRKLLVQQFVFVPLGKIVLASRVQAGFAYGRDELLPSDKFRAGGGTSVRGYGEDSLGPNTFGVPSGGERMLVLNQEMRFPMYRWVNGVVFVDGGNVFCRRSPIDPVSCTDDWGALRVGYGGGLRFNSPVGLLRADVGFPSVAPVTGRGTRWYFGIGHIF